ncbi:hypothetical protein H0H92_004769 [Tricholoma furcatifolium]|nr:hypothetical protein H0H92_004769 [Tricholoma furcatifolium]
MERRKIRELQDTSKEGEKEYQKLKVQLDRFKRKALLAPHSNGPDSFQAYGNNPSDDQNRTQQQRPFGAGINMNNTNMGAVIDGMETNGIQRTPLANRTASFVPPPMAGIPQQGNTWVQQPPPQRKRQQKLHRQPFAGPTDLSYRSTTEQSDSANEVENLLSHQSNRGHSGFNGWSTVPTEPSDSANEVENILSHQSNRGHSGFNGWATTPQHRTNQQNAQAYPNNTATRRASNKFKPASGFNGR